MMRRPLIVAEVGANHLGSLDRALELVEVAAQAGASAVKFQCWLQDSMCVSDDYVVERGAWAGQSMRELYRTAHMPWSWLPTLFDYARVHGLEPFASAFDIPSVELLESLGVERHKVASYEITDLALIRAMAATGKPLMLSTGATGSYGIYRAVKTAAAAGAGRITILKCVSQYPSDASAANLATMADLRRTYRSLPVDVGLSDHSMGCGVAAAAAALGADVIEKHLCWCRADGGPDAGFSMEPAEFRAMVEACRQAAVAVGQVSYDTPDDGLRRSLWLVRDAVAGERVTADHIAPARPDLGIGCARFEEVVGRRFAMSVAAGTPLTWEMVGGPG